MQNQASKNLTVKTFTKKYAQDSYYFGRKFKQLRGFNASDSLFLLMKVLA